MGDVVNLRTARKRVNRLAHGQPKAERALSEAHSDKARRDLDQHRIETGD